MIASAGIAPHWSDLVSRWASTEPTVAEVWAFGSRVKGGYRPDSDLDLAIAIDAETDVDRTTTAFFNIDRWQAAIQAGIEPQVDLHWLESGDLIMTPAVREHGMLIYQRSA